MPNAQTTVSRRHGLVLTALVVILLLGLPIAVWLDIRNLTEAALRRQATDLNSVITSVRAFYATNVVGRVLANPGSTQVTHNYESIPGAIPIPATLSLELGRVIGEQQKNINYRFVSDYPFQEPDAPHARRFREAGAGDAARTIRTSWSPRCPTSLFSDRVRLVAPVIMGAACVNCHNAHPDSPKRDWKVGDVRGMQEVSITQPFAANLFSFKYLLIYFLLVAATGLTFIVLQRRQALVISGMNRELGTANEFLASLSMKISRYLSPQIYKSIFSGQTDVTIHTERKKLTIFFSDIKDFTATTERLQPEQITRLLNEYFTEMSADRAPARRDHRQVRRRRDADLLRRSGDQGRGEDAMACLRMALDMQRRIAELNVEWRNEGVEHPFRVRMGINTGYLQRRQFRQRRPDGLHDHRRRGQPGRAPAVDRRARACRHQLRDLCAGARHRRRASAAADHDEGHQPRGRALRGRGDAQRSRRKDGRLQRALLRSRFLSRPDDARCAVRGTHTRRAPPGARHAGATQARRRAYADLNELQAGEGR